MRSQGPKLSSEGVIVWLIYSKVVTGQLEVSQRNESVSFIANREVENQSLNSVSQLLVVRSLTFKKLLRSVGLDRVRGRQLRMRG